MQQLDQPTPVPPESQLNPPSNPSYAALPGKTSSHLQWLFTTTQRMRQAETVELLLKTAVTEVRQSLHTDRVLVYSFDTETQGTVLAESLVEGYTPSSGASLPAIAFGAKRSIDYQQRQVVILEDSQKSLTPHQHHLLETFQVKASLSLPILIRDRVWGVFVVQQCCQSRQWREAEIVLLHQVVMELRLSLQQLDFRQERQALVRVNQTIRQAQSNTLLQTTARELRKFLNVERVAICKFRADYHGDFIAESYSGDGEAMVGRAWEDTYIHETQGGRFRHQECFTLEDVEGNPDLSPCHEEILKRAGIRACAIAPIFLDRSLWGLLCAYQHSAPRHWQEDDIQFLSQVALQLGETLHKTELLADKRNAEKHQQALPTILDRLSNTAFIDQACQTAVQEVRQLLGSERVAIYKFRPDYFGDFVYESEVGGFPALVGSAWEDTYLQEHKGGRFRLNEPYVADDIYTAGLSPCHIDTLEYFGVKAFLIVAIKQGEKLWGLLAAFQHSGPRHWLESEIALLTDIGRQLGATLQGADYLAQLQAQSAQLVRSAQVNQSIAQLVPKILQAQDVDAVFRTASQSMRILLKCNRVTVYRFQPDWSCEWVAESSAKGSDSWQDAEVSAIWAKRLQPQALQNGQSLSRDQQVVNNIHASGHAAYDIELLEDFEVKAYLMAPIFSGKTLWGLIGAYESEAPRSWAEVEISALTQIGVQIGAAMQQLDYLRQVQQQANALTQAAERERLVNKIVDRIQRSLDLQKAFQTTARELRNFLNVDRVAIFQFHTDSNYNDGETVAEDVRPGYTSALGAKVTDHCFGERHAELYRKGRTWAVADIYQAGLAECYIDILSRFQVRGNLVVPLLKGQDLWGLFCIHQCSGPRHWQDSEVEFAKQIAAQLNVAIQQGEYIEQLQQKSQQLAAAAQQDKSVKEQLQQEVIQVLLAVRPALQGDLTVRAPVTNTEVGTIADAYNNTLSSLRQIVMQMQVAAQQVAKTSETSDSSMTRLATQAQEQFQILSQILEQVQAVTQSTTTVETNAQQVGSAIQQTYEIVQVGDQAIDRTVGEMQHIRETVAETNKRLKRLSESSQKISKVVNLISNFTTQTQLLALNASIEATRAGEYGRGFAVVAEEVRTLARQSANAATEIEQLVQEIQANTAEVATAMETGIQQVASGTQVVTEARQSLNAIVHATSQINQLVTSITQATQGQIQQFQAMKHTMSEVAAIANKTSEDSITVSTSFRELLSMAQDLQLRTNQFKVD